jgi:undecaprenyl diphosphate synthase
MLTNTLRLITEQSIDENLMTTLTGSPPLDIFVHTSGAKRLSGFLQWQVCVYRPFSSPRLLHLPFEKRSTRCSRLAWSLHL